MATKKPDAGYAPEVASPPVNDYVICELRYDSGISYTASKFAGPSAVEAEASSLNKVLASYKIKRFRSHFASDSKEVRKRATAAPASIDAPISAEFAQSGHVQIVPQSSQSAPRSPSGSTRRSPCGRLSLLPGPCRRRSPRARAVPRATSSPPRVTSIRRQTVSERLRCGTGQVARASE